MPSALERSKRNRFLRAPLPLLVGLFWAAFLFGGSSSTVNNLVLLLLTLVSGGALAVFMMIPPDSNAPVARPVLWLAYAMLGLAVAHILPLPPLLWKALPGRGLEQEILAVASPGALWMPLSLRPLDSVRALLAVVPAFAIFLGLTRISLAQIPVFLAWTLGAIGVSALIAVVQVSTDGAMLSLYETRHTGYFLGIFSNRNHHADAILFGYLAACHLAGGLANRRLRLPVHLSLTALLAVFIAVTGSRTGALLALLAAPLALALFPHVRAAFRHKAIASGLVVAAAVIAAIILLSAPGRQMIARFGGSLAEEHRFEYWRIAKPLVAQYWTTGSGFGSFPALYMTIEPVSVLRMRFVNAAHSDYLQLAIEGGAPALLLAGLVAIVIWRSASTLRLSIAPQHAPTRLAVLMLLSILATMLHSLADYPLRTISLASVWAAAMAIFFRMTSAARQEPGDRLIPQ